MYIKFCCLIYTQYILYSKWNIHKFAHRVRDDGVKKLLFDDNKIKMARKRRKKQKENPVGYTVEG